MINTNTTKYCPKCKSRLYSDDEKYMNSVGVCGYCVTWDKTGKYNPNFKDGKFVGKEI